MKMTIDELLKKFYEKFENPANSESYDTHEGGYLNEKHFLDTDKAILEAFHDEISEETKAELEKRLNKESHSWVMKHE